MLASGFIRGSQQLQRDPNWELKQASEEKTSVFVESIPYSIMTVIGYLGPRKLGSGQNIAHWAVDQSTKDVYKLKFYFEDVLIQNCYGIQVDSIMLAGLPTNKTVVSRRTDDMLCGDMIDDYITGDLAYHDFSDRGARLQFRTVNNPDVVHKIDIFDPDGRQNGFYTIEQLFNAIKSKVKQFMDNHYFPETLNTELFVNDDGRIVFAWSGVNIFAQTGGFDIDLNPATSTMWKYLLNYFTVEKFSRNTFTYGTVVDGSGVSLMRNTRGVSDGEGPNVGNTLNLFVAVSPELSQFEKNDSVTVLGTSGEIATFYPRPFFNNQTTKTSSIYATATDGTLHAPKLDFDPSYTLESFTVSIDVGVDSELLNSFILQLGATEIKNNNIVAALNQQNILNRLHLVLSAKIF